MKNNAQSSVYLIAIGAFALGMASYVTAGLIPMIETSFSVSVSMAAQLVTAFTLAYGLGSPIFVAIMPSSKQKSNLLIALMLFFLANAGSALATSFTWLLVFRALAGIGAGVYLAMGISASASISGPSNQGKAIAIIMGGMASGVVLGVPLSLLLAQHFGWQSALWLISLLGVISFIGLAVKLPTLPSGHKSTLGEKLSILRDANVVTILTVSLLAAISSLGMYTFIAPLVKSSDFSIDLSLTSYLWVWGLGGVVGSFLVGPVVDKVKGPVLTFAILLILALSLLSLPLLAGMNQWLLMVPVALWGAVGWALQVPQNNELISSRMTAGDGNLAVALNESALYLGSAIGAALGGVMLSFEIPVWMLAVAAGAVAVLGCILQLYIIRRNRHLEFLSDVKLNS
ncbi:MFS transporter [Pantoea ananatis]|uniref:MFS transporter n=1 Tax=Pantoea ananas TaxID=553 RepID=UPI000B6154DE|nr:MFS transporter [Pantoea ananatis]ASN16626.1 MFS transporter [Pantoea ananatis]PQK90374.1 MFS transporter [Pantoea ananatis]PWV88936.1 putative MFS family arabinose efflux permease [Pantoea ananatis]RQN05035.1 MFS transporter [Pantoea ananatis]